MIGKKTETSLQKKQSAEPELTHDLPVYLPATDIYEKADSILVMCDMPGVEQKDVDITIEDDVLTLTGRQKIETGDGYALVYRGFTPGIFRRSFSIAADINRDGIKAQISNGVLQVMLPKAEHALPRKIKVE